MDKCVGRKYLVLPKMCLDLNRIGLEEARKLIAGVVSRMRDEIKKDFPEVDALSSSPHAPEFLIPDHLLPRIKKRYMVVPISHN